MGYDSGCIADANFLLFRLSLSARRIGDGQKEKEEAADAALHGPPPVFHKFGVF